MVWLQPWLIFVSFFWLNVLSSYGGDNFEGGMILHTLSASIRDWEWPKFITIICTSVSHIQKVVTTTNISLPHFKYLALLWLSHFLFCSHCYACITIVQILKSSLFFVRLFCVKLVTISWCLTIVTLMGWLLLIIIMYH